MTDGISDRVTGLLAEPGDRVRFLIGSAESVLITISIIAACVLTGVSDGDTVTKLGFAAGAAVVVGKSVSTVPKHSPSSRKEPDCSFGSENGFLRSKLLPEGLGIVTGTGLTLLSFTLESLLLTTAEAAVCAAAVGAGLLFVTGWHLGPRIGCDRRRYAFLLVGAGALVVVLTVLVP